MKSPVTTSGKPSVTRLRVLLFLLLWFSYGTVINSSNLIDFDLQHIGIEAIVERGHFYLEHSSPLHRQSKGDVFEYRGHNYAAKQPGQFMTGAVVYFLLRRLGLSYVNQYQFTAALVTFFTTSLLLAISAVALFDLARALAVEDNSLFWPLAATLGYALGSSAFAYSGIAHHDAMATAYLVIAFYLIFQLSQTGATSAFAGGLADGQLATVGHPLTQVVLTKPTERVQYFRTAAAGLLLGLTVTTSMLPFFMVVLCTIYFLSLRRWKLLPILLAGVIAGLLPLFVYDAVSFGNPFLLPNIAGAHVFSDTYFYFDPKNLGGKLFSYTRSLMTYVPVFAVGLFGLSYYPSRIKRGPAFLTLLAMVIALALFVLNVKSDGDCQFGPRYLLPAMPFACLGIAGYSYLSRSLERRLAGTVVILVGTASFAINLVGAARGAMNCPHGENALWNSVGSLQHGLDLTYPLAWWLVLPLLACLSLLVLNIAGWRKA